MNEDYLLAAVELAVFRTEDFARKIGRRPNDTGSLVYNMIRSGWLERVDGATVRITPKTLDYIRNRLTRAQRNAEIAACARDLAAADATYCQSLLNHASRARADSIIINTARTGG